MKSDRFVVFYFHGLIGYHVTRIVRDGINVSSRIIKKKELRFSIEYDRIICHKNHFATVFHVSADDFMQTLDQIDFLDSQKEVRSKRIHGVWVERQRRHDDDDAIITTLVE